jgi:hypothetical protein
MLLDRKIPVGSLHPVLLTDTRNLRGELDLLGAAADVLDHRVAEDQIEGSIGERELRSITQNNRFIRPDFVPRPRLVQENQTRHHGR